MAVLEPLPINDRGSSASVCASAAILACLASLGQVYEQYFLFLNIKIRKKTFLKLTQALFEIEMKEKTEETVESLSADQLAERINQMFQKKEWIKPNRFLWFIKKATR